MAAPDVEIDDGKGILLSVLCVINISSFSCDGRICDQSMVAKWLLSVLLVSDQPVYIRMCPQWLAVVGSDHHSDKIATTTNSLTSTKIST